MISPYCWDLRWVASYHLHIQDLCLKCPKIMSKYAHYSHLTAKFAYRKPSNRTLAYQDKLPQLPIPSLEDTCNRYLRALEALQDEKEHASTKAAVKQFLETDGPVLHDMLKEYAKDKARFVLLSHMSRLFSNCGVSYIEEFW